MEVLRWNKGLFKIESDLIISPNSYFCFKQISELSFYVFKVLKARWAIVRLVGVKFNPLECSGVLL